jgi:phosphoglucomutase/phosphoglucomutase/phosphopentomutase
MVNSIDLAKSWIKLDPNEKTRNHVQDLIHKEDLTELSKIFPSDGSRIGFGTAGLRSAMKPGPLGMNDLVIIQTTQGLARYCQKVASNSNSSSTTNNMKKRLAVVGYDHRANPELNLSSKIFAIYTKLVFLQAGFDCILLEGYVATPLIPFATTLYGADCGIMVTASHNPKDDAGFKVYWNDGTQIRPPIDADIASSIVEESNLTPWVDYESILKAKMNECNDDLFGLGDKKYTIEISDAYYDSVSKSGLVTDQRNLVFPKAAPKICYTAMHGVGYKWALKVFDVFELPPFLSVPEQQTPDYEFSTVPFPNPEEKGALDLAQAFADENECNIILANDPDADRLAVAERNKETGTWTVFTGDQIGSMLGLWIWETIGERSEKPVAMCASTVSSKLLETIAKKEGFHFEDTLTGFKWIGSRANELRQEGYRSLFAYEEAIGFCCGEVVSDKDGLTAMGTMAKLANHVYSHGISLADHMQGIYDKYGEFVSNNGYYYCYDPTMTAKILDRIRNENKYFDRVGEYDIVAIRDLGYPGYDSSTIDKKPVLPVSKSSPMMTIKFSNQCVVQIRASGTEPKLKYYIEMQGKPGVARKDVEKDLDEFCRIVLNELLQPKQNGLIEPKL